MRIHPRFVTISGLCLLLALLVGSPGFALVQAPATPHAPPSPVAAPRAEISRLALEALRHLAVFESLDVVEHEHCSGSVGEALDRSLEVNVLAASRPGSILEELDLAAALPLADLIDAAIHRNAVQPAPQVRRTQCGRLPVKGQEGILHCILRFV